MELSTLRTEIATWLQQDLDGTNPVWTSDEVDDAIRRAISEFSALRLKDNQDDDVEYSSSEIELPPKYISIYRVSKAGVTLPIIDVQELALTGISDPLQTSGTDAYVVEFYNTDGTRVLRFAPKTADITDEVDLYYKAEIIMPDSDGDIIEVNDWFMPAIKFRALGHLFLQDTVGKDVQRAELFFSISEVIEKAVSALFPIGSSIR